MPFVEASYLSLEREASERSDSFALGLATLEKTHTFVATLPFMSVILAQLEDYFS